MYIVVVNPLMRNLRFVNPSTLFGDKINQSNSCFEQELRNNNINQIIVEDKEKYIGIVHIHDILKEGIL